MEVPGIDLETEANDPLMERDKEVAEEPGNDLEKRAKDPCAEGANERAEEMRSDLETKVNVSPTVCAKELRDDPGIDWEKRAMSANNRFTAQEWDCKGEDSTIYLRENSCPETALCRRHGR